MSLPFNIFPTTNISRFGTEPIQMLNVDPIA